MTDKLNKTTMEAEALKRVRKDFLLFHREPNISREGIIAHFDAIKERFYHNGETTNIFDAIIDKRNEKNVLLKNDPDNPVHSYILMRNIYSSVNRELKKIDPDYTEENRNAETIAMREQCKRGDFDLEEEFTYYTGEDANRLLEFMESVKDEVDRRWEHFSSLQYTENTKNILMDLVEKDRNAFDGLSISRSALERVRSLDKSKSAESGVFEHLASNETKKLTRTIERDNEFF